MTYKDDIEKINLRKNKLIQIYQLQKNNFSKTSIAINDNYKTYSQNDILLLLNEYVKNDLDTEEFVIHINSYKIHNRKIKNIKEILVKLDENLEFNKIFLKEISEINDISLILSKSYKHNKYVDIYSRYKNDYPNYKKELNKYLQMDSIFDYNEHFLNQFLQNITPEIISQYFLPKSKLNQNLLKLIRLKESLNVSNKLDLSLLFKIKNTKEIEEVTLLFNNYISYKILSDSLEQIIYKISTTHIFQNISWEEAKNYTNNITLNMKKDDIENYYYKIYDFYDYANYLYENRYLEKIVLENDKQEILNKINDEWKNLDFKTFEKSIDFDSYPIVTYAREIYEKINKLNKNISFLLSDLKMIFETNYFYKSVFELDITNIDKKFSKNKKNFNNKFLNSEKILDILEDIKSEISIFNKEYLQVIEPITYVKEKYNLSDTKLEDYNNYYLYILSKKIQNHNNLYGINKNIKAEIINYLIDKVETNLYKLTNDQKKAIWKCVELSNMNQNSNGLIQGDVSSGKTIVSVILMFAYALSGYKSMYIIPRRTLRIQHLNSLKKYNELFNLNLKIIDSDMMDDLTDQDIIINGYSLRNSKFRNLDISLAFIDEIQLFGVDQRLNIQKEYNNIDMFYTTATPHPRTKLISLIGDMDIIEIKEMPIGRKPKKTKIFEKWTNSMTKLINSESKKNNMTLIVCPRVSNSDGSWENVHDAYDFYKTKFKNLHVEKLLVTYSTRKKEDIMNRCLNGEIDILVATKNIEVGIDLPNASIIIVHYPYTLRFKWGMSQLHQLRGRVGRKNQESYCYIEYPGKPDPLSPTGSILKTQDVFELTQSDINWRGFEKIIGIKQSGTSLKNENYKEKIEIYKDISINAKKVSENISLSLNKKIIKAIEEKPILNIN